MKPTAVFEPFSGRVTIKLFGKACGDMSLATEEGRSNIGSMLTSQGLSTVYAPRPSEFNAELCRPQDLVQEVALGDGTKAMRGVNAEGLLLEKDTPFYLSSADCFTVVFLDMLQGTCVVAHTGMKSLYDHKMLLGNESPRAFASVVDHAMSHFPPKTRKHVKVFVTLGIAPQNYPHPWGSDQSGSRNEKICRHLLSEVGSTCLHGYAYLGQVDLYDIIFIQLLRRGILSHNIGFDGANTYADRGANDYAWWSHRRAQDEQSDTKKRNGVLVTLNW